MEKLTFNEAFAKMQSEIPLIKKTENNPFFKSKYASLPNILEVVTPILQKNGFYITQSPISDGVNVGVETNLVHITSGEELNGRFTMPLAKADPQGAGSAITYGRRYAIVCMLGLNVDEDDDGNLASNKKAPKPLTKDDIKSDDIDY